LACVFSKETGDKLLAWFVDSQWFLLKIPLKTALVMFGADTFTNFVNATKEWKNNPVTTKSWFIAIMTSFMNALSQKYEVISTPESIKEMVENVFA
jgi:hypothetical protein